MGNNNEEENNGLVLPMYTSPVARDGSTGTGTFTPAKVDITPKEPVNETHVTLKTELGAQPKKVQPSNNYSAVNSSVQTGNTVAGFTPGTYPKYMDEKIHEVSDEDVRAFIGKNYNKFVSKKFNWSFFFFGNFYMFYRKLLLKGLIYTFVVAAIGGILEALIQIPGISSLFVIAINIYYCFRINEVYYKEACNRTNRIEAENSQLNNEAMMSLLSKKGGGSLLYVLFGFLLTLAVSMVIAFIIFLISLIGLLSIFSSINKISLKTDNSFDMSRYTYTLPEEYADINESNFMSTYSCKIKVEGIANEGSIESIRDGYRDTTNNLYDKVGNGNKIYNYHNIPNIKSDDVVWYGMKNEDDTYMYFAQIGNDKIVITNRYESVEDEHKEDCRLDGENFVKSFKRG